MVFMKSGGGHFMLKLNIQDQNGVKELIQQHKKNTVLMQVATEFARKIKFKKFTLVFMKNYNGPKIKYPGLEQRFGKIQDFPQ